MEGRAAEERAVCLDLVDLLAVVFVWDAELLVLRCVRSVGRVELAGEEAGAGVAVFGVSLAREIAEEGV